jgi:phage minor structural protein
MIRYYDRNETHFNHNQTILTPITCYIIEEANGLFELECELAKNVNIIEGDIIKAPSPRGDNQLFRIYRVKKSLRGKTAYARHIFYDLSKNFVINVDLNNVSGFTAIQSVLSNTETTHNFVASSDVVSQNSATYTKINPVQAIIGDENSILNLWGGNLIRNNFNINIKSVGTDRGYEIRMGKNLIGIDADIDESSVKTKIYPTVTYNDEVIALPEKFVDSPLINNYGEPIIYTEEVKLTDEQKTLPVADIYTIMRDYCNDLFNLFNIDKPVVNYKVDFVELSKTVQYKDLAVLEELDLYDIVTVNVSHLNINVKARVIKYRYDCLKERYESIELGDFSSVSSYKTDGIVKRLQSGIKASQSAAEYATNVITGNKGGYVVIRRYPDGKPYEILIMDTEDINTAQNVFRLNNSGLGFSRSGYNGTYETAMTIDGHIVADYMDTGTLTSILLQSDNYIVDTSGMRINLADGTFDSKYFKVYSNGKIEAVDGTFSGNITGSIISGTTINGSKFYATASSYLETFINISYDSYMSTLSPSTLQIIDADDPNGYISLDTLNGITVGDPYSSVNSTFIYNYGIETPSINNGIPITSENYEDYPPSLSTLDISVDLTPDGNLNFPGTENGAAVNWVQANYVTKNTYNSLLARVEALESA